MPIPVGPDLEASRAVAQQRAGQPRGERPLQREGGYLRLTVERGEAQAIVGFRRDVEHDFSSL